MAAIQYRKYVNLKKRRPSQPDGIPVQYGGGLQYHPTIIPTFGTMMAPPPGYDENDYKTLSTIQVRPVDPQLDLDAVF